MFAVTNPVTGLVVEQVPTASDEQIADAITRAAREHESWRSRPVRERAEALRAAARLFLDQADTLVAAMTLEMGKRTSEGHEELALAAAIFDYYADHAEGMLADEPIRLEGAQGVIEKRSIGVLLGIMPWNYPHYQVARFAAPNLVLGNTVLLKHAPSCPTSAALIEQVLVDAGIPANAFINLYAGDEQVADILADPRVQGVSLTGSERAGVAVATEAGKNLKKVVLELGGSDPMIILDGADVPAIARMAAMVRMYNAGQSCNAPKRMIVMSDIYDEFVEALTATVEGLVPGDPADPATTLAPLSSVGAADRLVGQVDRAVAQGAVVRTGGRRVGGRGAFVEPTVLTDVRPGTDAYTEELFGPVAVVYRVDSEAEAVDVANDSPFGLGSSVFSDDLERARRVGSQLDVGMVYINAPGFTQPDLPFGGVKRSGVGRELGALGIEEFMNKRIVRI